MARQYINWKLLIILVVGTGVFGTVAFALHALQKNRKVEQSLPQGEKAYTEGRWEEAADSLGRYLYVHADKIPLWMEYADAHLNVRPQKSSNLSRARDAYKAVLRLDPGNEEATRRLVGFCLTWRQFADANDRIVQYLKIKKDDPTLRRLRGVALINLEKSNDAAGVLTQLLKDHPDEVLAYEVMGRWAEDRPKDANQPATYWFDEAVRQNPNSALAYIIRASFHVDERDPNAAVIDLDKAGTLDLSDTTVHLRLVGELLRAAPLDKALDKAGVLDKARAHLEVLQAKLPKNLTVWGYSAELALRSKSTEEMQKVARTALKEMTDPNRLDFLPKAAELLIKADQFQDANDCIAQIHQKNLSEADVAFLRGLESRKHDRLSDTKKQWEEAINLRYGGSAPLRIDLADVLRQMGDLQSAVAQLRALVADYPKYLDARLALMRMLMLTQARDWTAVLEQSGQVLQLDPRNGEALLRQLQAQIQLLAANGPAAAQDGAWRDIENQLAQLDKENKGDASVKLLRVQTAMLQKKDSQASALLDELQSSGYDEVQVAWLRAQLYVNQEKEREAISLLRTTMKKFPQDIRPVGYLASLLNQPDKRDECESLVKEAMAAAQQRNDRRQLGLLLARLYGSWGNKADEVKTLLYDVMTQFPDDLQIKCLILDRVVLDIAEAQKRVGQTKLQAEALRRIDELIAEAQKIVDQIKPIEGEKGWIYQFEQARVWFLSKDFEAHYADIMRLLKANLQVLPDNLTSRLLLAAAYQKHGELQLAASGYREALNLDPENIQIILLTVDALNKAGDAKGAQDILNGVADRTISNLNRQRLRELELRNKVQLGEWDSVSEVLKQLAAADPNDTSTNLDLASVLVRQKHYDEAQAILDRLKAKASQSVKLTDREVQSYTDTQVQLYVAQGNGDKAIQMCNDAVKSRDDVSAYRLRTWTYSQLNQATKAVEDIQMALLRDANDPRTVKLAASLFISSRDPMLVRRAGSLLDRASAAYPDDADLKYSRARLLILKGTAPANTQARQLLTEITRDQPGSPGAWEQLGRLELQEGQPGRAVDVALGGLAHSPNDRGLLLLKAQGEAERSSAVQAVPTLEALARLYPNDVEVALRLADADLESDRSGKALELLQQRIGSLKEGVDRRRYETALAVALYRSGQTDNGTKQLAALLQAEPNDVSPLLTFARMLVIKKDWMELQQLMTNWTSLHSQDFATPTAIAEWLSQSQGGPESNGMAERLLTLALQRNPKFTPALDILAVLLQNTGRNSEAISMNQRALDANPNDTMAINNLAWLLCEDQKQYTKALELANKGLGIAPEYCDLIDTRGVIYYRMGNYDAAIRDLQKCIELCPAGLPLAAQAHFHLGRVYYATKIVGRGKEAITELQKALSTQAAFDEQKRPGGMPEADKEEARRLLGQLQNSSS